MVPHLRRGHNIQFSMQRVHGNTVAAVYASHHTFTSPASVVDDDSEDSQCNAGEQRRPAWHKHQDPAVEARTGRAAHTTQGGGGGGVINPILRTVVHRGKGGGGREFQ